MSREITICYSYCKSLLGWELLFEGPELNNNQQKVLFVAAKVNNNWAKQLFGESLLNNYQQKVLFIIPMVNGYLAVTAQITV